MPLPRNNREIVLIKQGGEKASYDNEGRKQLTCIWEEVEHFKCVDHAPTSRGAESDATTTHGLETYRELETFYFSMHNQSHNCDFNMKRGYYIVQRLGVSCNNDDCEVGIIFWKVVAVRYYEIMSGCWDFKITGERLGGRETRDLVLECKPYIRQLEGVITYDHD